MILRGISYTEYHTLFATEEGSVFQLAVGVRTEVTVKKYYISFLKQFASQVLQNKLQIK